MLFTDVQRSVRLNKKEKSTNTSPYPDEVIDRLARAFYPAILACWNSEEGQREFAAWQAEQAHHANNEKQKVPTGAFLPRGTQSAGHGLFESALLLLHKIHAKQKEQHPIRCCSWCSKAIQIRTISLRCNFCRFSKSHGLCPFFIVKGNENLIIV